MSKKWLYLPCAALVLSVGLTPAFADRDHDDDHGHGNGHAYGHEKHDRDGDRRQDRREDRREDRRYYGDHDRDLHDWYRAHYNNLPPGFIQGGTCQLTTCPPGTTCAPGTACPPGTTPP